MLPIEQVEIVARFTAIKTKIYLSGEFLKKSIIVLDYRESCFPSPMHCRVTQCGSTLRKQNCQRDDCGERLLAANFRTLSAHGGRTELTPLEHCGVHPHIRVERELMLLLQMTQVQLPAPHLLSHNCLINLVPKDPPVDSTCVHTDGNGSVIFSLV